MTTRILVIGGTGTLGRIVVDHLFTAGADVRVLSRGRRPHHPDVKHATGNVRSRDGLDAAVAGVDTIVACVDPVERLVAAAKRATQFHDLIALIMRVMAKPPVMALPAGFSDQPVDVREVGQRMAGLALDEPAGRAPDFAGPEVRRMDDLARSYLSMVGKRRPILPVWLPGKVFRAFRAGGHLAPDHAAGTITFEQFLSEQLAAGRAPYRDAVNDYLRIRPRTDPR